MTVYAFDHIRRYFWHQCTTDPDPLVRELIFRVYWRYMLMC
jgi:hypothetical protein